ncbi:MAG: hypothetical protein EOO09_01095 [Chitinophagaceae bacterium]|nr:MAG: hypothetical protein EOO09_01095 [Chitinophagaceae bacterium]
MKKIIHHSLLWLIALSVLNTSVDITEWPDFRVPAGSLADVEYNEIESIVEMVMDETSDHEQQLPDQNGNDQQSLVKKASFYDFSLPVKKLNLLSPFLVALNARPEEVTSRNDLAAGYVLRLTQPPDQG